MMLTAPAWAATYYVSNSTANGYVVGSNGNAGTSPSTAWATIDYANTTAVDNDIIYINDGTHYVATFLNCVKNLTWLPVTAGAVTVRSTTPNATRLINFNATQAKAVTQTWGAINLDAQNSSLYVVSVAADAYTFNLTFNGTTFTNPQQSFLNASSTMLNLAMNNITGNGSAITRNGFIATALASGSININGATLSQIGNNVAGTGLMDFKATATGVTASIQNVNGILALDPTATSTGIHNGIRVYNIANALLANNNVTINNAPGSRTAIVYWIGPDPTTAVDSSGGVIRNNIGYNNTNGGIMALIGQDDSTVAAPSHNTANNGQIYGNTFTGAATSENALHGSMLGNSTGGSVYKNRIDRVNIGVLAKGQTNGIIYNNLITRVTGQYLRAKASTSTLFANNTAIGSSGYMAYGILADHDTVTSIYSSGVQFNNNILYTSAIPSGALASVSAGSTATFSNNLYYSSASYPANPWSYQGTGYATISAWQASREANALNIDPLFVGGGDYHLQPVSAAFRAGLAIDGVTRVNSTTPAGDYSGTYYSLTRPAIGAFSQASLTGGGGSPTLTTFFGF